MLERIIGVLSLTDYKKKEEILKELKKGKIDILIGTHALIEENVVFKNLGLVAQNNKLFGEGKVDYYIAHSNKGYKLTFNWEEMKKSIADNRKRAITMLADCTKAEIAFQKRNYLQFTDLDD